MVPWEARSGRKAARASLGLGEIRKTLANEHFGNIWPVKPQLAVLCLENESINSQ